MKKYNKEENYMKEERKYRKSNGYQICSNCVMDTSDPEIEFDQYGICRRCNDFYEYILPKWNHGSGHELELKKILYKIKKAGRRKPFDCILGISGGVDSCYLLHLAVKEFDLRVLVAHVDSGWDMPFAKRNIERMVSKLNVELIVEKIDKNEFRNFQLAMFKAGVPDLDIPQDMAFVSIIDNLAIKNGIKYILNGGNISTEVIINPKAWSYWGTDLRYVKDILNKFGKIKMETYPFTSIFKRKILIPYLKGIKTIKLLNYVPYKVFDAKKLLNSEYGWEDYQQKHFESKLTKFIEGFWLPKRFGYDIRRAQYSSLILTGQMKREEALKKLSNPAISDDEAISLIKEVAEGLEITVEELMSYIDLPKKTYKNYKNTKRIFDIGSKILFIFGIDKLIRR